MAVSQVRMLETEPGFSSKVTMLLATEPSLQLRQYGFKDVHWEPNFKTLSVLKWDISWGLIIESQRGTELEIDLPVNAEAFFDKAVAEGQVEADHPVSVLSFTTKHQFWT